MGTEGDYIQVFKDREYKQEPRCHILQLLFQGITGFRIQEIVILFLRIQSIDFLPISISKDISVVDKIATVCCALVNTCDSIVPFDETDILFTSRACFKRRD